MKRIDPPHRFSRLLIAASGCAVLVGAQSPARADNEVITAVYSQVSDDYHRTKLPDGSFQAEAYTFGEGGHLAGPMRDDSVDKLSFLELAKIAAVPLADQKFIPAGEGDPNETRILIMVYWGKTSGTEHSSGSVAYQNLQASQLGPPTPPPPPPSGNTHVSPGGAQTAAIARAARENNLTGTLAAVSAENNLRNQIDAQNAALLGYDGELAASAELEMTAFRLRRDDLVAEIEENRYLVVLMAYDFQELWKHKRHKLLWVTRMSVCERGTDFTKILPAMVGYGSQYFGQDSGGLLRKPLPMGRVDVGAVKSLGVVPEK